MAASIVHDDVYGVFSSEWYLACNPDIGMDPLEHYMLFGRQQGLLPNGYGPGAVDRDWYLQRYSDLEAGVDPAIHYVTHGWLEGRDPNPHFSTAWYLACYPGLGMNPLVHYLVWGRDEGRLPNGRGPGAVDERWYLERYLDLDRATEAAVHYAERGWREGRDPNRSFSTGWYLANNPGIGMNPLVHYVQYGRLEGRSPRPTFQQTVRSAQWLTWKLCPLFAMAYATVLHLGAPLLAACAPLLIVLAAIAPGAAYAAMINDLTDRADDAAVGKPNAMTGHTPQAIAGMLACCLVPGVMFLVLWRTAPLLFGAYLAAWVVFSIYSFPPLRLKTRGAWGVLAEASASALFPTLVAVLVLYRWFGAPMDASFVAAIGTWSMAFGIRGILGHQMVDRWNDAAAAVETLVRRHGDGLARRLIGISFAVETAALLAILLPLGSVILAAVTLAYATLDVFVYRSLSMKTVIVPPDGDVDGRFKLALHSYYQIYLPLGLLLQLSLANVGSAVVAIVAFVLLSLEALRRERDILVEAVVRSYYPLQPVVDRPRRVATRNVDDPLDPEMSSQPVARGVRFLSRRQRADGSFVVYYSSDHTLTRGCTDDRTPFCAAMVANCLSSVASEEADEVIAKTTNFFMSEMRMGIWGYFIRAHPYYNNIPTDVDDTSCISVILRRQKIDFPDNRDILMLNRDRRGLFYTWIKPRFRITGNLRYWRLLRPQLLHPFRSYLYWQVFNARPNDVDLLINANVLWYLGNDDPDHPVVTALREALLREEEENCDKWYRNRFLFYYKASRAIIGIPSDRDDMRQIILDRTVAALPGGTNPLDLALGICAMMNCGASSTIELRQAVDRLLGAQDEDGGWGAFPMYYDGPKKVGAFGSEELTTAFCVEALARYARSSAQAEADSKP